MQVLKEMNDYGHENILFCQDKKVGLKAIIAVHNTVLGPALGGCRIWDYKTEEEALFDVLRLSKGMTLKNAGCGLQLGGGKTVVIGDPKKIKNREFFHSLAYFVNSLNGTYYTAEDVNTNDQDMTWIGEKTKYVSGTPAVSGNPSPFTALGTYKGMKAGAKFTFGSDSLKGKVIAMQGLGHVGYGVAEYASKEGAKLKVYDISKERVEKAVKELGAESVSAEEIFTTQCDIFSPCALGNVLNPENVVKLKSKLICGCTNNPLRDTETATVLEQHGMVFCPDYIVNAGGVINCGVEIESGGKYNKDEVIERCNKIYDTTLTILQHAKEKKITSYEAAEAYSMGIIAKKAASAK